MMRRLKLNLPLGLGLILLLGMLVLVLLPFFMELADPNAAQLMILENDILIRFPPFRPGKFGFRLGTDFVGRDLMSRVIYGARLTLGLALAINLVRPLLAVPLGLWSGWRKGWLGRAVQAVASGLGAIPTLLVVALTLGSLQGFVARDAAWPWIYGVTLVLVGIPRMAEFVRRRAEEVVTLPHVEAAQSLGASPRRIIWRHIFPVMLPDMLVMLATEMAWVLLMMAQLAILGIYLQGTVLVAREGFSPLPVEYAAEWGQMLGANRGALRTHTWIGLYPGLALGFSAMTFHLLAEGLRLRGLRR